MFYANLQTLVGDVEGAGKIAVVPTIPYSPEPTHLANIPGLNAQIANLYVNHASVVPGPDLFTYFEQNPSLIPSDQVHPTDLGCVDYRALWGQSAIGQYATSGSTTPTVAISASPTTVPAAGQSTLAWSSTNATSCTASGSWTGSEATSGNLIVAPTTTSSYTITCTGPGGAGYATTQVTVH